MKKYKQGYNAYLIDNEYRKEKKFKERLQNRTILEDKEEKK